MTPSFQVVQSVADRHIEIPELDPKFAGDLRGVQLVGFSDRPLQEVAGSFGLEVGGELDNYVSNRIVETNPGQFVFLSPTPVVGQVDQSPKTQTAGTGWFMARPARIPQLHGSFAAIWDDILPPTPKPVWKENLATVARALIAGGGTAHI